VATIGNLRIALRQKTFGYVPVRLPRLETSKRGAWRLRGEWLEQVAHNP